MLEYDHSSNIRMMGYGQNGDKPKRRQVKTATPKRRQTKTATSQNGDKP